MRCFTLDTLYPACFATGTLDNQKGRACRPHRRHRAHRRRRRASVGSRNQHSSDRSAEKTTIDVNTNTNPPLPRNKDEGEGEEEEEQKHCCGPARRPCAISTTTPTSADRCPVSPAIGPGGGGLSPGLSPPAVFNDLVLILDAPALPPPPWKLPNLPEEIDVSVVASNQTGRDLPFVCVLLTVVRNIDIFNIWKLEIDTATLYDTWY